MCSFVAWLTLEDDRPVPSDLLGPMLDTLRHRGPDKGRLAVLDNVGIGHRRLRVIDLETGGQPMASADVKVWVAFNGKTWVRKYSVPL